MAAKRIKPGGHENHDRWLVSYADFITLLFAFFVVMFANARSDKNQAKAVSDSLRAALDQGQFTKELLSALGRGKPETKPAPLVQPEAPPPARIADLAKSLATLELGLGAELKSGKVQLKLETRGLVISLREATFFASGNDTVAPAGFEIIAKIAKEIQALPNPVRLEGHTDSVPIHNSRFHSNWELSSARAIAVLELLRQQFQIPPERLAVAGYAENAPVDTNDSEEGRAHNRRVDLVVLSAEAVKEEPQAEARPALPGAR